MHYIIGTCSNSPMCDTDCCRCDRYEEEEKNGKIEVGSNPKHYEKNRQVSHNPIDSIRADN